MYGFNRMVRDLIGGSGTVRRLERWGSIFEWWTQNEDESTLFLVVRGTDSGRWHKQCFGMRMIHRNGGMKFLADQAERIAAARHEIERDARETRR